MPLRYGDDQRRRIDVKSNLAGFEVAFVAGIAPMTIIALWRDCLTWVSDWHQSLLMAASSFQIASVLLRSSLVIVREHPHLLQPWLPEVQMYSLVSACLGAVPIYSTYSILQNLEQGVSKRS